jgi:5-(carboxyamino)imidazole ribonucleotide mutase
MVAIMTDSNEATALFQHTREMLTRFAVPFTEHALAAAAAADHANLQQVVTDLESAGTMVFITANAMGASIAPMTVRPVLVVPIELPGVAPLDALKNTTSGGSVASLAIGKAGAINAALLAVAILANTNPLLREKLTQFRTQQTQAVLADRLD